MSMQELWTYRKTAESVSCARDWLNDQNKFVSPRKDFDIASSVTKISSILFTRGFSNYIFGSVKNMDILNQLPGKLWLKDIVINEWFLKAHVQYYGEGDVAFIPSDWFEIMRLLNAH